MSISGYKCDLSVYIYFFHVYQLLRSPEGEFMGVSVLLKTLKRSKKKKKKSQHPHEHRNQNEVTFSGHELQK